MSDDQHPGLGLSLDERINWKGHIERILTERDKTDAEREKRMDERFEQRDKALEAAFQAAKEANTKAELAQTLATTSVREETQIWQKEHNNLLREMVTQKESFAAKEDTQNLRAEMIAKIDGVMKQLAAKTDEQDTRLDLMHGARQGVSSAVAFMVTGAGFAMALLFYFLAHR
jgi:choline dehydrogenase-like flavoprotein